MRHALYTGLTFALYPGHLSIPQRSPPPPAGFMHLVDHAEPKAQPPSRCSFDPKSTFRHDYFPEYKANRDAQPEDITIATPFIRKILAAMKIPILCQHTRQMTLCCTIAKQAEKQRLRMCTWSLPNKDYTAGWIISLCTNLRARTMYKILGRKKFSNNEEIGSRSSIPLFDWTVDNIPGVPGMGPKQQSTYSKNMVP